MLGMVDDNGPAGEKPVISAAERARQREIQSYLNAASIVVDGVNILDQPTADDAPRLSHDVNLNALVQLGAVRLDTDRAFLSLIDGKYQYIIAESTRTHSISCNGIYEKEGDQLYLGLRCLPIGWGVCPNTMSVFTDETGSLVINEENIQADKRRYVIRDMLADAHYSKCPYVMGFPYMRTYAEVPLISPLGYVIGSYCVVDTQVRDFDNASIRVLAEVCQTIMNHLGLMRTKESWVRSERLVRGLGSFMERESRIPQEDDAQSSKASEAAVDTTSSEQLQAALPHRPQPTESGSSDGSVQTQLSIASSPGLPAPDEGTPLSTPIDIADENPFERQKLTPERHESQEGILSVTVLLALQRAAALIRAAMDIDGFAFLDAVPHGFASRSSPTTWKENQDPFSDTREEESDQSGDKDSAMCTALVRSMRYEPSSTIMATGISPTTPGVSPSPLREVALQRLIRRYPRGHIFSADEYGPIDESFRPGTKISSSRSGNWRTSAERQDVSDIFRLRPEARYLVFLPLWHFQRECWFLASFAWTTNPAQAFSNEDLTYLSAFGHSIMAEIARFETLAINRAKSDFISSISHELRSPLHGVLASTELLRETLTDPTQSSLLDMIESCGNTLLDTMNHLLDFAKINNLTQRSVKGTEIKGDADQGELSITSSVDLSDLVQEVVESVHLGHASKYTASSAQMDSASPYEDQTVLVTMNIEHRDNWEFDVEVGAWKRIVMNLFGNALKYTPAGQITVSLSVVDELDQTGKRRPHLCFAVQDTGIGMSPDYLKYHVFTPFAQENSLSPGTGLGLSIVKQVVKTLGGQLNLESRQNVGTNVTVLIPTRYHTAGVTEAANCVYDHCRGKSISILPLEYYHGAVTDYKAQRLAAAGKAIDEIVRTWLQIETIPWTTATSPENTPDFCILDTSLLADSMDLTSALASLGSLGNSKTRPVLLCYGLRDGRGLDNSFIRLRQPLGPKTLSLALRSARQMTTDRPLSPSQPHEPLLTAALCVPESVSQSKPPLAFSSPPAVPLPSTPAKLGITAKHHILLVDDNPINLKLLSTQIERLGHTYTSAMNGLEAIQLFKASMLPFDYVFMDISMPVMNGFEATQEIRSFEKAAGRDHGATIVALTGLGSNLSKQEAFSSGVNVFLTKPVSLKEVKKLLGGAGG